MAWKSCPTSKIPVSAADRDLSSAPGDNKRSGSHCAGSLPIGFHAGSAARNDTYDRLEPGSTGREAGNHDDGGSDGSGSSSNGSWLPVGDQCRVSADGEPASGGVGPGEVNCRKNPDQMETEIHENDRAMRNSGKGGGEGEGEGGGGGGDERGGETEKDKESDDDDDDSSDDDDDDEEKVENLRRIANRFSFYEKEINGDSKIDKKREQASEEGCRVQRLLDKIGELEDVTSRLKREKVAVAELMSMKSSEFEDERRRVGTKLQDLEEEVQRLRVEKARLVNLFKLPESDRVSMREMENELEEMRKKLAEGDSKCCHLLAENDDLRNEVKDLELEMQELHDQFQQEESLELRELRKELENAARDIRLLHFKLRKAERRTDELKNERDDYEDRFRKLEDRGRSSEDDRKRLRRLEEELRTAKEVSIRMHDECQRMEREQRKMEDELEMLRRGRQLVETGGNGFGMTSEQSGSGRSAFSGEKSFESSSSLSWMLQSVLETVNNRIPKVEDTTTCLRLCRDLEKVLQGAGCPEDPSQGLTKTPSSPGQGGTLGVAPETEGKEEKQERENELKLQLALADEESKILRRKLTEMRTDNENLMRAVEYLRKKLEQNDVSESPPTRHRTTASEKETGSGSGKLEMKVKDAQQRGEGQGENGTMRSNRVLNGGDGNEENSKSSLRTPENRTVELEKEVKVLREECQRLKGQGQLIADDRNELDELKDKKTDNTLEHTNAIKWKNRTMELQNEIVLLTEELQTTTEENDRLEKEVRICRSELESLLETLRRKERQFGEERKVLKRRNNDLSKMFDLLTERASTRRRMENLDDDETRDDREEEDASRRRRPTVDDATQTDRADEDSMLLEIEAFDRYKAIMKKEKSDLELDLKAKEEILKSKEEIIKRKDFLLSRAVKSLQDLEANVEEKTTLINGKEEELAKMENDLKYCKERENILEKEVKKMEEKVRTLEAVAEEREKLKIQLSSVESELQMTLEKVRGLEDDLQSKDVEIRALRSDQQQTKTQLERSKVKIQELEIDRDGFLREIKRITAETSKEKSRLETELEKVSTERNLAKKELAEMEARCKRGEAEKEGSRSRLNVVESRSRWTRNVQDSEQRTQGFPKSQEAINKLSTKANIVKIPVLHERSSFSSAGSASSSSSSTSAGGIAFAAVALVTDASRPETELETRTGTGTGNLKVLSTQRFRTTEELNPVLADNEDSVSRQVEDWSPWSSATDQHRSRRSRRTVSVDRCSSMSRTNGTSVPVPFTAELMSFRSLLPDSTSAGRRIIQLTGNKAPSVDAQSSAVELLPSETEAEQNGGDPKNAGEQTISVAPVHQLREPRSESAELVAQVTHKFRKPEKNMQESSNSSPDFRRRSRSVSEFDVFSADESGAFQVVQPPTSPFEMIPLDDSPSIIPQLTPHFRCTSSDAAENPSIGPAAIPLTSASPQGHSLTSGIVLRQRKNNGTGPGVRGSFYASGTLSASASRASSPVRMDPLRRLTPYPVPPPSMIITPARTPIRASSSDRSDRTFSQGDVELLRRKLKDVESKASGSNHQPEISESGTKNHGTETVGVIEPLPSDVVGFRRCNDFYHSWSRPKVERPDRREKAEKRSVSVSPRTARRKFFDEYPYDPPKDKAKPDRWVRKGNDDVAEKMSFSDVREEPTDDVAVNSDAKSALEDPAAQRKQETGIRRKAMLGFSTLPFFRKKALDPEQRQKQQQESTRLPVAVATSGESTKLTKSLPRLQLPKFSIASSYGASRNSEGHRQMEAGLRLSPESGSGCEDGKENGFQDQKISNESKKCRELKKSKSMDPGEQNVNSKETNSQRQVDRHSRDSANFGFGLRKHAPPPTSTQSLHEDLTNSIKFQKIIKPFRKFGAPVGVPGVTGAGGGGRDDGRAAAGGRVTSKQNSRILFPAFHSLSESTIRSISLSNDLLKELNVGRSRISVKSDEGDLVDDQSKTTPSGSSSSSHSIQMPEDGVQFRSLDRKSKRFF